MKIEEIIKGVKNNRQKLVRLGLVLLVVMGVFIGVTYYGDAFWSFSSTLAIIEFTILVVAAWALAGHAVTKSLFHIGAGLSLMIFLAQSYCGTSNLTQSGNDALKLLLGFSFLYLVFDFAKSLYKEMTNNTGILKKINNNKYPWFFLALLVLFVIVFIRSLYQVILPIAHGLCIYQ